MARAYSQMRRTDMYSEHSSIIWPVCPNGCVLVYQLNRSGFESSSSTIYTHLQPIIVFIEDVTGYKIGESGKRSISISHLFFVDDLKTYASDEKGATL